jgi:hypothetical protein
MSGASSRARSRVTYQCRSQRSSNSSASVYLKTDIRGVISKMARSYFAVAAKLLKSTSDTAAR